MATGSSMTTAVGLACLVIILLATGLLPSPASGSDSSRSPCLQQQQQTTMDLGRHGTRRRLLGYDLRRTRLDDVTTDNSSYSPYYQQQQWNSSSPYYQQEGNSSLPWGTGGYAAASSRKPSAMKYVVPIGCSVVAVALVVTLVFWWVGRSRRRVRQLGRPVNDEEMMPPPPNHARDNRPKPLTLQKIKRITENFHYLLGEGAFGKVYLGSLEGNQIAVKQLIHKRLNVSTVQFKREMGILMEVKHKNLVKFLAYCDEGDDRFLCFEFLSGGSLDKLLYASKRNETKESYVRGNDMLLDWGRRYYIIKEVCTGLHYLHVEWDSQEKILHLDLKASNILIDQGGKVVKIADFGISRLFVANKTYEYITNEYIGMRAYLPKECLTAKPKVSQKVDIYCYGMFLLEMVTGWCATDGDFPGVPRFIEMVLL